MKTLMTAVLLAALAAAGFAKGDEPAGPPATAPGKPAGKAVTLAELGQMLEDMGYAPKPAKGKDGAVYGYDVVLEASDMTVYCTAGVSTNGQAIWMHGRLARTADASTPAEALLAMLGANFDLSPAAITYDPVSKKFDVVLTMPNGNVTPVGLRVALNQFARGVQQALAVWDRATAKAPMGATTPSLLP